MKAHAAPRLLLTVLALFVPVPEVEVQDELLEEIVSCLRIAVVTDSGAKVPDSVFALLNDPEAVRADDQIFEVLKSFVKKPTKAPVPEAVPLGRWSSFSTPKKAGEKGLDVVLVVDNLKATKAGKERKTYGNKNRSVQSTHTATRTQAHMRLYDLTTGKKPIDDWQTTRQSQAPFVLNLRNGNAPKQTKGSPKNQLLRIMRDGCDKATQVVSYHRLWNRRDELAAHPGTGSPATFGKLWTTVWLGAQERGYLPTGSLRTLMIRRLRHLTTVDNPSDEMIKKELDVANLAAKRAGILEANDWGKTLRVSSASGFISKLEERQREIQKRIDYAIGNSHTASGLNGVHVVLVSEPGFELPKDADFYALADHLLDTVPSGSEEASRLKARPGKAATVLIIEFPMGMRQGKRQEVGKMKVVRRVKSVTDPDKLNEILHEAHERARTMPRTTVKRR